MERALDLGCGDGRLTAELDAAELTAADVSPVALERARRGCAGARVVELEPDAPLPFDDDGFDLVLCAETIEHVRDVQLLLSEIRRVLARGGELALTTPATPRLARPEDALLAAPAPLHAAVAAGARWTSWASRSARCGAAGDAAGAGATAQAPVGPARAARAASR